MTDRPANRARRDWLQLALGLAATACVPACAAVPAPACKATPWRSWRDFVAKHIQADGRVVDFSMPDQRSTSEGQSYALFFALVDNDQALFERLLGWTRHNLCGGRPDLQLPAWLWGKAADGQWRVLDENNATDADLWIAYTLLEAGRLWARPGYVRAGQQMLALLRKQVRIDVPKLGPMLLPGRTGFATATRWTFNPSYVPLQLLRRAAAVDPAGGWNALINPTVAMIRGSAPVGFAADWIAWDGASFSVDPAKGALGSYDAIRAYLWTGMLDAKEPARAGLLKALAGPQQLLKAQGRFAEKIDITQGVVTGQAPAGFAAALLPYLSALGEPALLSAQAGRVPAPGSAAATALPYYERTLVLFGQGWMDQRYRFALDGRLIPAWRTPACSATT